MVWASLPPAGPLQLHLSGRSGCVLHPSGLRRCAIVVLRALACSRHSGWAYGAASEITCKSVNVLCMRWLLGTCFLRKWFSGFSLIRVCSLAMCVALSACTTPDPASPLLLRDEVAPLIKNGMPLADVMATLRSRSFSCMEGTSLNPQGKGIFECTRSRGPWWPPYSCIHRIWFDATAPNGAISNLRVFDPVCASL